MLWTNLLLATLASCAPASIPRFSYPESDFYFNVISDEGQLTVNSSALTLGYTGADTSASGNEFHIDDDGFLNYNNREYNSHGHIAFDTTNKAVLVEGKGNPANKSASSPFSVEKSFGKPIVAFDSFPVAWACPGFNGTWQMHRYGCGSNCPDNLKGEARPLFVSELPGSAVRLPFGLENKDHFLLTVDGSDIDAVHGNSTDWNIAYGGQLVDLESKRFVKVGSDGKFGLTGPNDIEAASTGFMKIGDKLQYNGNDGFHLESKGDQEFAVYAGGDDHLTILLVNKDIPELPPLEGDW